MNKQQIKWIAKDLKIKGKVYALHPDTKEVYDIDDYKNAVQTGSLLEPIGKLEEKENKKVKFVKY